MTALDDAVKAALDGECEFEIVEIAPRWHGDAPDEVTICATHGCDWRDDEPIPCDEHRKIGGAVRAGWAAAIDAATTRLDAAADRAMAGTGPGYGDEAYERAVNAARIAYGDALFAVHFLRLPEGDRS